MVAITVAMMGRGKRGNELLVSRLTKRGTLTLWLRMQLGDGHFVQRTPDHFAYDFLEKLSHLGLLLQGNGVGGFGGTLNRFCGKGEGGNF